MCALISKVVVDGGSADLLLWSWSHDGSLASDFLLMMFQSSGDR